jgi:hypothetical protein
MALGIPEGKVILGTEQVQIVKGSGSPELNIIAPVGSVYLRTDGGVTGTTFYVKEAGTGATGWAGK